MIVRILTEQKAEVLELVLTTFNRELYEQGLKEDAAREANEEIAKLKKQLNNREKQLADRNNLMKNVGALLSWRKN